MLNLHVEYGMEQTGGKMIHSKLEFCWWCFVSWQ